MIGIRRCKSQVRRPCFFVLPVCVVAVAGNQVESTTAEPGNPNIRQVRNLQKQHLVQYAVRTGIVVVGCLGSGQQFSV